MYRDFFQLKENPFNVTADPGFFYNSARHAEAFSHLTYGIRERKGIIVITGEIGAGKTTLCRMLLSKLDENTRTALILNPSFSEVQLLQVILNDLGIKGNFRNKYSLIQALNDFLITETNNGHNVALIIDEAQNLKPRQLEQVRLLSNLETEKEKLLQIILVGQPELGDVLKSPSLKQLSQRVTVRYHITPLEQNETKDYIHHRLNVASAETPNTALPEFLPAAMERIYQYSQGTPRMINVLCDRLLLAGFLKGTKTFDEHLVQECIKEIV